jgi:Tfp pilus assembly protein PilF
MRIVLFIIALECVSLAVNAQNSNKRPDTYNYNRGLEELRKENYVEALTYLNKEVESDPQNGYAYSWIAMIRHTQEELGQSVLSRLGKIEIDNSNHLIKITHTK